MDTPSGGEERDRYLQRVRDHQRWFSLVSVRLTRQYQGLQIASVVLAGTTPLLILISQLPKVIQALPAALAAMVSGISAIYGYPGRIAAYGSAQDEIESELIRFEHALTPYDGNDAFILFVERVEKVISRGAAEGRAAWLNALAASDAASRR
jgi:hypothetical protein